MKTFLRRGLIVGAVAGAAYAAWRLLASRTPDTGGLRFESQPFPAPPRPVDGTPAPGAAPGTGPRPDPHGPAWVEPAADGTCPVTHPIKGKLNTGIFHPPGAFAYDRTHADRCYRDEAAATEDGLRAAKR